MAKETVKNKEVKKDTVVMPVRVFGKEAKKSDTTPVPEGMKITASAELLSQAVLTASSRRRIRRAHTKIRKEVRGGGAKPWAQKGTGRARHGSRRSPIWVGGGITFGPRSRKSAVRFLPTSMAKKSLSGSFALKLKDEKLEVVKFEGDLPKKTKDMVKALGGARRLLIIIDAKHKDLIRVSRNLKLVVVKIAPLVTVEDILKAETVWIDEKAMDILNKRTQK